MINHKDISSDISLDISRDISSQVICDTSHVIYHVIYHKDQTYYMKVRNNDAAFATPVSLLAVVYIVLDKSFSSPSLYNVGTPLHFVYEGDIFMSACL